MIQNYLFFVQIPVRHPIPPHSPLLMPHREKTSSSDLLTVSKKMKNALKHRHNHRRNSPLSNNNDDECNKPLKLAPLSRYPTPIKIHEKERPVRSLRSAVHFTSSLDLRKNSTEWKNRPGIVRKKILIQSLIQSTELNV
ncbi:unnamed protein product [Lepeophtheirus salmonis]|uniref:(salmon louse) hypothetical protein n=1 Tax=Lepeophtheirus salmonis TaxID=72036 RepID=A0A7R8CN34_LEPSM|nr:unnamed protein product [Lepeophtheirus salmonis]CAF2842588.1 unnamed protein product [Lepeophtheirus salmonis]